MEKYIKIKTKDDHFIYGTLNYKKDDKDKLIIFVHGLTENQNDHQFYNAVEFFNPKGFATFRFDLYSWMPKGRKLKDCSIKTHSKDLDIVLKYFKNKYKKIYLVGHSFGGPTVIYSKIEPAKAIVLWDPSINNGKYKKDYIFNENLGCYIGNWSIACLISKEMFEEEINIDFYPEYHDKIVVPMKIICAEKGVLWKDWKKVISKFTNKKEFVVMKDADHCFTKEGNEETLFKETLKWFKKF